MAIKTSGKSTITGADDATVGTAVWSGLGYTYQADHANYATASIAAGESTHYLKLSDFHFAIPADAVITNIIPFAQRRQQGLVGGQTLTESAHVYKGGVMLPAISSHTLIDGTDKGFSFGTTLPLWGTTWTAADINSATFGMNYRVVSSALGSPVNLFVDYCKITITYRTGTFYDETVGVAAARVVLGGTTQLTMREVGGASTTRALTIGGDDFRTVMIIDETAGAIVLHSLMHGGDRVVMSEGITGNSGVFDQGVYDSGNYFLDVVAANCDIVAILDALDSYLHALQLRQYRLLNFHIDDTYVVSITV